MNAIKAAIFTFIIGGLVLLIVATILALSSMGAEPRLFSPLDGITLDNQMGWWHETPPDYNGDHVWSQRVGAGVFVTITSYPRQQCYLTALRIHGRSQPLVGRRPKKHLSFEDAAEEVYAWRVEKRDPYTGGRYARRENEEWEVPSSSGRDRVERSRPDPRHTGVVD